MILESVIQPEILKAYSETDYRVDADSPFVLHINEYNAALGELYKVNSVDSCVFITAYNPNGQLLADIVNEQNQKMLVSELDYNTLKYFPAEGKHPNGNWPGEPSYFILGLSLEKSCRLGKKYKQNAIVWCGPDLMPQLVVLR
jgi:hypothetical protein